MQLPLLSGIYSDSAGDFRTSYPVNLVPVPKSQGISAGYLRPSDGIVLHGTGPGIDRGGINWDGVCYRVMGTKLVSISATGVVTELGDVGSGGKCDFDYSFNSLAINSGGRLYYLTDGVFTECADPDLGNASSVMYVDGYFMMTDGDYIFVTDLNDKNSINPLKYGSSEIDPDPIQRLLKVRNEPYAVNRYTIEVFQNVGGDFFPFQRITSAHIQKGAIGPDAACVYADAIAFLGSGKGESPAVYIGENAQTTKISTREIDTILETYTEAQLAGVKLEKKVGKGHNHLYVHLPDRTLVYDAAATLELKEHVWFVLTSSVIGFEKYRAQNFVYCYGKWLCGDPTSTKLGILSDSVSSHFGDVVRHEVGTIITFGEIGGGIFHEVELVCLTGRVAFGDHPQISTSYSSDGMEWSVDIPISAGTFGDRAKRLVWLQNGLVKKYRIQRFKWDSRAHLTVARLEVKIEPLMV